MTETLVAAFAGVAGAVTVKAVDLLVTRANLGTNREISSVMSWQTEVRDLRSRIDLIETQLEEWKQKYWKLKEEFILQSSELFELEKKVKGNR
jgi:peptidoglycan hydrolase CwlO-like protein